MTKLPLKPAIEQPRDARTGQFGFEGDWGRLCKCGHELGVHTGEAPHECLNIDRRNIAGAINQPAWFDPTIKPTDCDCVKFRPAKERHP